MLGAVTEDGESFFSRFLEYVTAYYAKYFILAVYKEFEDDLIVILNGASFFRASAVTDLADRDGLEFVRLPAYRPDLNPVEKCWRQLESPLGDRYFESMNELTRTIGTALKQLSLPVVRALSSRRAPAQKRTKKGIWARMENEEYHHGPAPLGFTKNDGHLIEVRNYDRIRSVLEMV